MAGWRFPGSIRVLSSAKAPRTRLNDIVDTASGTLSYGSDGALEGRRVGFHFRIRFWVALVFFLLVVLGISIVKLPYFAFRPGSVNALTERVLVTVGERFDPAGEIFFTTVRQDSHVNGWEYLRAQFSDDIVLYGEDDVLGTRSRDENRALNFQLMQVSKSTAVAVALRHLGVDPYRATGVGMSGVEGPAEGLLTTEDVVVAVDGFPVATAEDLVSEIRSRVPGQIVDLDVESLDGLFRRSVEVTLGGRPEDSDVPFLGVMVQTRWEDVTDLPVDVRIETGNVGGNSAGLALTLAVLDLITPGEMTGGFNIATTGTINLDGTVGSIGGVVQKTITAREAEIDVFLVPKSEYDLAKKYGGDLRIEPVATLEDALSLLAQLGGNALDLNLPEPN